MSSPGHPGDGAGPRAAAVAFTALGALHLVWATGSSWPVSDADHQDGALSGRPPGQSPGPVACVAVAGLLGTAAALVAGDPRSHPRLTRLGSAGIVAAFTTRGLLGLAGRTDLVAPGATTERFRTLDRRYYAPLCLTLAALSAPAARRKHYCL
ncbi:MAG TPA: DUF3995 domain-containing protein [Baekduia sp.]